MRGWIYIITNKAMPELIKVGFSMQDPIIRAEQLNHTGSPHPYVVVYDALVRNPRQVESEIHRHMHAISEGKEWFRSSVVDAVGMIRSLLNERILHECFDENKAALLTVSPPVEDAKPTTRIRATGTFLGQCMHCKSRFSATLTRRDLAVNCPRCHRSTDVSQFLESKLAL